jgi:ribosomal-protein-alanine N-acetyltransferase
VLAALEELKASRAEQIFLDVEVGNSPAIKLYESIGFLVQRRRKLYYRQKDGSYTDALVMSKKIA